MAVFPKSGTLYGPKTIGSLINEDPQNWTPKSWKIACGYSQRGAVVSAASHQMPVRQPTYALLAARLWQCRRRAAVCVMLCIKHMCKHTHRRMYIYIYYRGLYIDMCIYLAVFLLSFGTVFGVL